MNYANPTYAGETYASKANVEHVDQVPARARLEAIAAAVNSLASNLAVTLEKVRGTRPIAADGSVGRSPESIEEWLGIIESRLKDAGYTAQQLDERL